MGYRTEMELVSAMVRAYYVERDVEQVIKCVTDDVEWIGTESNDCAFGKQELRELLLRDVELFPDAFQVEMEAPVIHQINDQVSRVRVLGRQVAVPKLICGFEIRVTACCIRQENETFLLDSIHVSVPNAETEKYSLAQELDETRKKEQTLMAGIPGGIAIYRLKKDGRVTTDYVSESLAKMCGYTEKEFLEYLREDSRVNVVPEDIPKVMESVSESLENDRPVNVLYHIYTKDKKRVLIRLDANMILTDQVEPDEVGILYAVHTMVSQDTMRRLQEQKHYRDILNVLDIAYWEWSAEAGYYTSERYAEYAISAEPNENIWDNEKCYPYIHPEDIASYQDYVKKNTMDSRRASAILRTKMKDGSYRWTEMFAFAELDEVGGLTRIISVMRDVDKEWLNQKEKLEAALLEAENANRAKTDFLSRVSHDMRTPLNGILGITSLLQGYVKDYKMKHDLFQLEQSGKYLLNLINDTLDVSKIESGKLELRLIVCDGKTVFDNVLHLIAPSMEERKIEFIVHEEELPFTMLYIDVGRVQQIVMNILGNAIKFTPVGGKIEVTMSNLRVENGMILDQVVVEDNGVGISEEFLPHLFEPFSQERNTSTSSSKGTGLGMTITKQILDLMGGTIKVESKVGYGTRFTFTLPMQIATEEQVKRWRRQQGEDSVSQELDQAHVLVCEDHPLNATIAIRLLEKRGMIVDWVENGLLGVNKFKKSRPGYYDAILMDIRMPVLNGIDATKTIRRLDREDASSVPIIAMTANALSSDMEETARAGMNAHLSKPIEVSRLYSTLEEMISRRNE